MVWCKAPFLLASLATLRKYSSFVIVDAINDEKSEKKGRKKNKEKGTILKGQEEKTAEKKQSSYVGICVAHVVETQ